MKYTRCSRCQLNYVAEGQQFCKVCQDELAGKKSIFNDDFDVALCPYCNKRQINADQIMCAKCLAKRCKNHLEDM